MGPGSSEIRRLGVFGGTFDPIHVGHLVAASEVAAEFGLDRVLFVPAGRPWQKDSYSDPEDRYAMTVLGTQSGKKFCVSRMEIDRKGPTFTADTLEVLDNFYSGRVEMLFITGMDAAANLATWQGLERIAGLAEIVAVSRPGFGPVDFSDGPGRPRVRTLEIPGVAVSATEIRERAGSGRPIDYLVPAPVARYIRSRRLYSRNGRK